MSKAPEEAEAVKVAVRVRAFNDRETSANSVKIVRMSREDVGSRTWIKNIDTNEEKEFHFDFSFDSHDVKDPDYATQDIVFADLGMTVLRSALEGKNTCLFAYGQTGAGKSYSMLGKTAIPELQGIVPRTCQEIFRLIDIDKADPSITNSVSIQVVEIYCEQLNDLLMNRKDWPPGGHKPRLTKDGYQMDTTSTQCDDYNTIETAFKTADANRSIRAHALNPVSSRAHTLYLIKYVKVKRLPGNKNETTTSMLNLVDLAGSERTESAGTTGEGLKEGNAINLSLTALGNTIKALSEGTRPGFRDSKLTLLLQHSMTDGQVIMIAALSPANICYEESVSTLRFAERIKTVKVKAKRNVTIDPVAEIKKQMETMRQKMQEEIDELRAKAGGVGSGGAPVVQSAEEVEKLKQLLEEQKASDRAMREEMERELRELKETAKEREDRKAKEAHAAMDRWKSVLGGATVEDKKDIKIPHLLNLNAESRLSETLIYKLEPGNTVVGKANKEKPPTLDFSGMGMMKDHCVFSYDNKAQPPTVHLKVTAAGARCLVNGKPVTQSVELKHNNRVWLGNNYAFRFAFPTQEAVGDQFPDPEVQPDYLYAEQEIAQQASGGAHGAEGGAPGIPGISGALGHKLSEALKNIEQANIISGDLNQDVAFQAKIITNRVTGENEVVVYVVTPSGTLTWVWDKFHVRLMNMVKQWEGWQYAQGHDEAFTIPPADNPFIDRDYQLIGEADVWLQSLGNMIEVDSEPPVLNPIGTHEGQAYVTLTPLDKNGNEGPWDNDDNADLDPFVEKASDLLGTTIQFAMKLHKVTFSIDLARGSKAKYKDTYISYQFDQDDNTTRHETKHDLSGELTQTYNDVVKFSKKVDKAFLHQIEKGKVTLYLWGKLVEGATTDMGKSVNYVLPEGWKKVTAFQDPQGQLHLAPPGGRPMTSAASS